MSKITVEDLGPMVERIAEATPDYAELNVLAQTHVKQRVLDLILPGVESLLAEVNGQLADAERAAERRGAVKALRDFAEGCEPPWQQYADERADAIENGRDL